MRCSGCGSGSAGPRAPGFTLVELCVVLALTGVLASLAWPSLQGQLQRGRRADAVVALMRVQMAQESYRANNGMYAAQLAGLQGASSTRSGEGLYDIELIAGSAERYEARARARAGSPAAGDAACEMLSLRVHEGVAEFAPSSRCWNR